MIRSKIAMGFLWALLALALHVVPGAVGPVHAQGSRKDDIVFNSRGIPLAGATVRVCAMPASGQPCTPLALIYSDAALTQALANPTTTDGLGNYFFYAAPGKYEIEISGPAITTKQIPNVILPNDPASPTFTGAVSAFSLTLSGNLTVSGSTTVVGNLASGTLNLANQSTPPGSAGSGTVNLYTKTADKHLYYKDDTGTETGPLGAGAQTTTVNTFTANQNLDGGLHIKGPDPYSDLARYGGSASSSSTTASTTNGSTSVTLTAALDFQDASAFAGTGVGHGIVIYKAGAATGLTTPPAPTVTPSGVTGGTTYNYKYAAEDLSGGLTAASAQGSTTTGAATLGITSVTLASVVWNNTLNGEQIYTCSGNCNVAVNAPIRIDGFTNARFNGNYTVIAQTATTFTVYSPSGIAPAVTTESAAATMKVLACTILTMPASSVASIETGGDTVLRYWVYRNNTLAFVVQSHDPYYEDCGMNMDNTRIPSYVPSSPGSAVNKYLATTIVSGGGTTSIVVANAAGATTSGQSALHDNSQNLLAALNASHFGTPVYVPGGMIFNGTTVFTNAKAANTKVLLPVGATINQPWVVKTNGIIFEGGQGYAQNTFAFDGTVQITGNGSAFPVVAVQPMSLNTTGGTIKFKNITFNAPAVGQTSFGVDFDANALFGLMMDNAGFLNNGGASNTNMPAAIIKGITESSIGYPGNRNACSTAQNVLGPPCMRFTTVSTAVQSGTVTIVGILQLNGWAMLGGGASYQFDSLPYINSGGSGNNVVSITSVKITEGLREQGKGPFLRVAGGAVGAFWMKYLDDDAPNAVVGNGWVDNAAGSNANSFYFESMGGSVGGQAAVAGAGNVVFGPSVGNLFLTNTSTSYSAAPGISGTGNITAQGSGTVGYSMAQPNAPSVVVGAHSSCASNCVAAGTYVYAIVANDIYARPSIISPGTSATTDGTQTITVSWVPVDGQVTTNPYRGATLVGANGSFVTGTGVAGTSYTDLGNIFYTVSQPNTSPATASGIGSLGLNGPQLTLTNGPFKNTISGTFTANRAATLEDASGFIPVTGEAFFSSPRAEQSVFLPGLLTSTWTSATWTTDKAVTITRIQVQAKTAPAGCTTNAIVRLTDGTTPVNVTISAAANDSGAISQNYAAGSALQVLVQTAAAGCTTSPADANVTVQYRMQ